MAVNLSPIGGVAAQFLDNSGNPLTGGKIFTYAAGTTTPQASYTSSNGAIAHSNPIILDAAGRVPSGEIWLTDGFQYKFLIKTSADVQIGSYDNIVGINSNFVNYTNSQEIQTATAGQTVFTLTTMQYQPGTNSLSVFVDGVNQYGPGALYAYVETSSTVVTFTSGLHVGADVKFTTTAINSSSATDAEQVSYTPPFTGGVVTNVEAKLAQTVSVKDFGAKGDNSTDDSAAINAASLYASTSGVGLYFPPGTYLAKNLFVYTNSYWKGASRASVIKLLSSSGVNDVLIKNKNCGTDINGSDAAFPGDNNIVLDSLSFDGNKAGQTNQISLIYWRRVQFSRIVGCRLFNSSGLAFDGCNAIDSNVIDGNLFQNNYGNDIRILWVSNRNIITNNTIIGANLPPVDGGESGAVYNDAIIISAVNVTGSVNFNCAENILANNVIKGKIVGLRLDGAFETIVKGNIFGSQTGATIITQQTGIFFCDGLNIVSNNITCESTTASGSIVLTATKRVSIVGNVMFSITLPPIYIGSSSENSIMTISANNISFTSPQDNADCIYILDGAATNIVGNNLRHGRNGINVPQPTIGVELRGLNIQSNEIIGCKRFGITIGNNGVGRVIRDLTIKDNVISGCATLAANTYDSIFVEQSGGAITDVYIDGNATFDYDTNTRDHVRISGTIINIVVEPNIKAIGLNGVLVTGYFNASPGAGTWYAGQRIYNFTPTAGSFEGWICTVSGPPGTWKTFGSISL
jgi:hypothetical protein